MKLLILVIFITMKKGIIKNETASDELINNIYDMYVQNGFGTNDICLKCRKLAKSKGKELINGPVPLFHVGKDFKHNNVRLLIVGMVAYGWSDIIPNAEQQWSTINKGDRQLKNNLMSKISERYKYIFFNENHRIIKYLRVALTNIYGNIDDAFDNVAITNYVHCNNSKGETKDTIPQSIRGFCANISQNGFIHKEIEVLKPTHVLSITKQWKYNRFLYHNHDNFKFLSIAHPSSRGRSNASFEKDIRNFIKE